MFPPFEFLFHNISANNKNNIYRTVDGTDNPLDSCRNNNESTSKKPTYESAL